MYQITKFTFMERNCCKIPNFICSSIICTICMTISLFIFFAGIIHPEHFVNVYMVGGNKLQAVITTGCIGVILTLSNISLAYGVAVDYPLFMLIWMGINIILWNIHFVFFACSFSMQMINIEDCDLYRSYSLLFIFTICVIWLICIILVAQHWYALCEEIYAQEYGQRPGQISNYRMLSVSNRTRLSAS